MARPEVVLPPVSREAHERIVREAVAAERAACRQLAVDASNQRDARKIKGESMALLIAMAIGARA